MFHISLVKCEMLRSKLFQSVDDLSPGPGQDWSTSPPQNNPPDPAVVLTETFYITSKKNTVFQVQLTRNGISLRKESNGSAKEQTIRMQDIIGCRCLRKKKPRSNKKSLSCSCSLPDSTTLKVVEANSGEQDESDTSAYLYIYAYVNNNKPGSQDKSAIPTTTTTTTTKSEPSKGPKDNARRDRTTITLRFRSFDKYEDNHKEAQKWRSAIKCLINHDEKVLQSPSKMSLVYVPRDTRKTLIILNPKSGSGKARESFQRVAPILMEAEMQFDMYVTKYPNWSREFVRSRDIYAWKNIVVVGGDGIYFEILNGLCERPDWERALDEIAIGIIPCGSGNGLAKTIAHLAR